MHGLSNNTQGGLRGQAINENKPGDSQDFFSENKVDGVSTPGIMEGRVYMLLSFQGVHASKGFKSCDLGGGIYVSYQSHHHVPCCSYASYVEGLG